MRSSEFARGFVLAVIGALAGAALLGGCSGPGTDSDSGSEAAPASTSGKSADGAELRLVSYQTPTMGTWGTVTIATTDSVESQASALRVKDAWDHVNELMSNWSQTSEISRINRGAGSDTLDMDPELSLVLDSALSVASASAGAFDVTVEPLVRLWGFLGAEPRVPKPSDIEQILGRIGWTKVWFDENQNRIFYRDPSLRVDLGGIAKGYGVDLAATSLRDVGETSVMINLSGNIRTIGTPPDRDAWAVGIRDPRDRVLYLATLRIGEVSMATSGQYEQFVDVDGKRYGHILDPRTGWPAEGVLSVTVLAPNAMMADAWATAFFVMGVNAAKDLAASRDDLQLILIEAAEHFAEASGSLSDDDSAGSDSGVSSAPGVDRMSDRDVFWVERSLAESFQLLDEVEFADVRIF